MKLKKKKKICGIRVPLKYFHCGTRVPLEYFQGTQVQ